MSWRPPRYILKDNSLAMRLSMYKGHIRRRHSLIRRRVTSRSVTCEFVGCLPLVFASQGGKESRKLLLHLPSFVVQFCNSSWLRQNAGVALFSLKRGSMFGLRFSVGGLLLFNLPWPLFPFLIGRGLRTNKGSRPLLWSLLSPCCRTMKRLTSCPSPVAPIAEQSAESTHCKHVSVNVPDHVR